MNPCTHKPTQEIYTHFSMPSLLLLHSGIYNNMLTPWGCFHTTEQHTCSMQQCLDTQRSESWNTTQGYIAIPSASWTFAITLNLADLHICRLKYCASYFFAVSIHQKIEDTKNTYHWQSLETSEHLFKSTVIQIFLQQESVLATRVKQKLPLPLKLSCIWETPICECFSQNTYL